MVKIHELDLSTQYMIGQLRRIDFGAIHQNPEINVYVTQGEEGGQEKYGFSIGVIDGKDRPLTLTSSALSFGSPEKAKEVGEGLVKAIKSLDEDEIFKDR